ncbi:MAG: ribonuclease R, partial [Clostridia bacterium]|nr:ribonuclease R [Clostridia bacterium]
MIGTNEEAVLAFMREEAYRPLTEEELRSALGVPPSETEAFRRLLDGMEAAGAIVRTRKARYGVPERMNLLVGTFQGHEKGFGFVVPLEPDGGTDVYVAPKDMNGAMNGDRVVVRLTSRGTNGRRCEGEVIRILHRANPTVVGTLERRDGYGYVSPDDRKLAFNIFVPGPGLADARDGEKVVVAITVWPDSRRGPEGRVLQRLGLAGEPGVDILSVLYKYMYIIKIS